MSPSRQRLISQNKFSSISGFTLIEIVISLSILAIVVGVTYLSLRNIILSKQILEDRRDSERIAQVILNRLPRELQLAFSGTPLMTHPEQEKQGQLSSKVNLVGIEKSLDDNNSGDLITFVALEGGQYLPDGGSHSGVVQITYRVQKDPEHPDSDYYLVREEMPLIKPEERAKSKIMTFPVTDRIVSLSFRYFDRTENEWVKNWGSEGHLKLPAMVEIAFKIRSPMGHIDSYTTSVALRSIY